MAGGVFFRFDDIGAADRITFRFIELMESLERPYVLAVIPDALGWRMKRVLRATRHAAIFQHGKNHKSRCGSDAPDEFPQELGRKTIEDNIRRGRQALEKALGKEVPGYVPPWNRISELALRVLEEQDFKMLSADTVLSTTLRQLPVSVDVYSSYRPVTVRCNAEIEELILQSLARSETVGVMLHPRSAPASKVAQLEEMIRSNRSRMCAAL